VDCVVVYKVGRLSRSLLDFARMMEAFDRHRVSFVSVTQQFNTATSMGRLVLHVLLSFAQFEREIISERTRDKIAATRRKGKWAGGHPVLGYDVDSNGFKLVVNADEAVQVRAIFDLYLEHESLLPVVKELDRRGWANKRWVTRAGKERGGKPFTRTNLYRLLTNVAYVGQVRYKDEAFAGEHPGIVDPGARQRVQALLRRNGSTGGAPVRNRFGALLKGLLRCVPCGCAMTPTHTTRGGARRYRCYVCSNAQKRGWDTCPSKSIPAAQIEGFVVEQIRCVGRDQALLAETVAQARKQDEARLAELGAERRSLDRELARAHAELKKLSGQLSGDGDHARVVSRLAEQQERIGQLERRLAQVRDHVQAARGRLVDEGEAARALAQFGPVWESLTPPEQTRVVQLLVERVDYDGSKGRVAIAFHASGIKTLAEELAEQLQQGRSA
jgi:site-specific DNA recombinase